MLRAFQLYRNTDIVSNILFAKFCDSISPLFFRINNQKVENTVNFQGFLMSQYFFMIIPKIYCEILSFVPTSVKNS